MSGSNTAFELGQAIGGVLQFLPLVLGGIFSYKLKREGAPFARLVRPAVFGFIVSAAIFYGRNYVAPKHMERPPEVEILEERLGNAPAYPDTISETEAKQMAERSRQYFLNGLQESEIPGDIVNTSFETSLINLSKSNVILTKIELDGKIFIRRFTGIKDGRAINLHCNSKTGASFEFEGSQCEKRLHELFGNPIEKKIPNNG